MRSGIAWLIAIRLASGHAEKQYARRSDYSLAEEASSRVQAFDVDVDMSGGMTVKVKKAQTFAQGLDDACPPGLADRLDEESCDDDWLAPTCSKIKCKKKPGEMFKELCDMCNKLESSSTATIKGEDCLSVYDSLCMDFDTGSDTSGQSATSSATSAYDDYDDDYVVPEDYEDEEYDEAPKRKKKKSKKSSKDASTDTLDLDPGKLEAGATTGCPWCCGGNLCGKPGPLGWDGQGLRACLSAAVLAYLSVA